MHLTQSDDNYFLHEPYYNLTENMVVPIYSKLLLSLT